MTNPVFSELIQIIEEEYTKEDTVKFKCKKCSYEWIEVI